MEDVAALNDITGPSVLSVIAERYQRRQYYTYFGDFLLSFNPCHPPIQDESQIGYWYQKSKPLEELPAHVLAVAHRVYRMVLTDFTPQAVLLTGRSGSGKTYAARSLVTQLMREARLSPVASLGPKIVMAQHVLKTLVSASCPGSPLSTRCILVNTLYYRPDGQLASGEVCSLCLDKWRLVDRSPGCGSFTIFYAMLGGMHDLDLKTYYLVDRYRLLERNDGSSLFYGSEDHGRHVEIFDFFQTCLEQLGIDMKIRNFGGEEVSSILSLLAAILHLGNLQVITHSQTGQTVVANHHELRAAADLLSVRPDQLEAGILYTTTFVQGEMMRAPGTTEQTAWRRDSLLVEMYRRMISVITGRINALLIPQPQHGNHGALTPVTVIEASAHENLHVNRLETLLRNMAVERIQRHLNEVIFGKDVDACEREKMQAYKIKFTDNGELLTLVFKPEGGLLTSISMATTDPRGSPESLVTSLDKDKAFKKSGCYVSTRKMSRSTFAIQHTEGQVTYDASDFLSRNHGVLPEDLRQLLLHSANPLVATLAGVNFQPSEFPPEYLQPESFFATSTLQNDLAYLTQKLEGSNLHYIRCLRPNSHLTSPVFDQAEVTSQLKEACVVEMARQRKFGYSTCISQQEFVRSFRTLAFSSVTYITSLPLACNDILARAGLLGRGSVVTKTSVFLRYWHVHRLHALKAQDIRNIIIAQSAVRGFLVRRRVRGKMTSQQQEAAIGHFFDEVSRAGAWTWRAVQEQADHDRNRFESQLQHSIHREHHPRGSQNWRGGGDPYTGDRSGDDRHYSLHDDSRSSLMLDDDQLFYNDVVERVLSSQDSLPEATWAKIIYMERSKQVAKAYVEARSVIVDGSFTVFDGDRFGVGGCRNPARDEETAYHRSFIQEGVRLKRDADGSVWACRLCDHPIIVKGLDNPDVGCLSADVVLCKGQLPQEKMIKVFDIKEFRSKIALDLEQHRFSRSRLRRACVIGLSLGRDEVSDLDTACWLCVVNLKALHALDSEEIIREAQLQSAQLKMTSEEEKVAQLEEDDAKSRMNRTRWAKIDQRDHLQMKDAGSRQMRQQLRAQRLSVGENLGYSWDQAPGSKRTTMGALHQMVEPRYSGRSERGERVRSWAKLETAIRDSRIRSQPDEGGNDGLEVRPDYD